MVFDLARRRRWQIARPAIAAMLGEPRQTRCDIPELRVQLCGKPGKRHRIRNARQLPGLLGQKLGRLHARCSQKKGLSNAPSTHLPPARLSDGQNARQPLFHGR